MRTFAIFAFLSFFALAVPVFARFAHADGPALAVGQQFPLEKLTDDKHIADSKIIVFIPSLTEDCEYASMLTQSFYYYFDRKLAFTDAAKAPETKIILVVGDKTDAARSRQNILGRMSVIYDEKGDRSAVFGIAQPVSKNASATVFLLDAGNRIVLIDKNYRAQGEHLKPLENKLKELNGLALKVPPDRRSRELKVGETAPDFPISATEKLSDLRGRVVLLSFYPAAFSGILPKTDGFHLSSATDPFALSPKDLMACSYQIGALDGKPAGFASGEDAARLMISGSTAPLLTEWQKTLNTHSIVFVNDADYSIALKYGSFNPQGYNNRVSVIVDRQGKIAYIDPFFNANDEVMINRKIEELLKSRK